MSSKISNIQLFKKLGNFCQIKGSTRLVCVNEFVNEYKKLALGNGGSWCRFDFLSKKYKVMTIKKNGKFRFSKGFTDEEENELKKFYIPPLIQIDKKGNSIKYIKFCGFNNQQFNRSIAKHIRDFYVNMPCVVCGNSDTEIDHKNGLYNDQRVLNPKTQKIEDFQPLCRHCNQQKREVVKKMKKTGIRPSALDIPQLSIFGIPYTKGDESYDENDVNWGEGTYWNDPIKFMEELNYLIKK